MRSIVSARLVTALFIAIVLCVPCAVTVAAPPDAQRDFQLAATRIDEYRFEVLDQQTEVIEAPRLALPLTYESTIDALVDMRAIEVQPCFAEWWANEYVSLKLAALYTLYMQEDATAQAKVDHTGWLADQLHLEAQKLRSDTFEGCAFPAAAG